MCIWAQSPLLSQSLPCSGFPPRHALNEIVIKCFNIEVTKGPATLA